MKRIKPSGKLVWRTYEITATIWFKTFDDENLSAGRAEILGKHGINIHASIPVEVVKVQTGKLYTDRQP
jgi:hypothetical protein